MQERSFRLEILLVSMAAILLEIGYTRIFSYKLYYYFTYLILGIALLGLGSGGVFVAVSARLRQALPERLVALGCLAAAAMVPASYTLVALVQLNTADLVEGAAGPAKLAVICLALFAPFLVVGVLLATILGARLRDVSRLYFADLVGAGLGCAAAVPLLDAIGPPRTVLLGGVLFAVAGARLAWRGAPGVLAAAGAVGLLLLAPLAFPGLVLDPVPDTLKVMSPQKRKQMPVLLSRWSSVFRIDVIEGVTPDKYYWIAHDGLLGSIVRHFDGDWEPLRDEFETGDRSIPYRLLPPEPRTLIIGSAGGHEILVSRYFGAEVTGVELNPVTASLLTDHFADYSGNLTDDPRVRLVNAEGRSFLARDDGRYDLIWLVAPDSYSARSSASAGAFVLSESYLYTVEMVRESLGHLSEGGMLCAQFGEVAIGTRPNRTTRFLATAREALRREGIHDFQSHVLTSTAKGIFPNVTVIVRGTPFTAAEVQRFREAVAGVEDGRVLHPGGDDASGSTGTASPAVSAVITLPADELAAWHAGQPYDVTPVTDDSPFFWHFARFGDALSGAWGERALIWDPEIGTGERMLLTLLAFAVAFAAVFLLLPLLLVRDAWARIPYKSNAGLYFAALGLGFMLVEVCLIQKLTLFLGYPTHSLTVTLAALLLWSGVGSLLSARAAAHRNGSLLGLVVVLALATALLQWGTDVLVANFVGAPLFARVALCALLLAPVGLVLGAFMPIGLTTVAAVSEHEREYIAWAWAVNGFFSVMSSVLATILAMSWGFQLVLWLAVGIYAVGALSLSRIPQPTSGSRIPSQGGG